MAHHALTEPPDPALTRTSAGSSLSLSLSLPPEMPAATLLLLILPLMAAACNLLAAGATVFTLQNRCPHPVWPGALSGNALTALGGGGFLLRRGESVSLEAPAGWSGRLWARTGCVFDPTGSSGNCTTGDCGGSLRCSVAGRPPVTLAEFTLGDGLDSYDVSVVDGYNVAVGVASSDQACRYAGCVVDLNERCPAELRVVGDSGETVACRSACEAFGLEAYCCTGPHASPTTCGPTRYSRMFKSACPAAYSYAYDDAATTFTCPAGSAFLVTFCP